jgi:hypothetical protein
MRLLLPPPRAVIEPGPDEGEEGETGVDLIGFSRSLLTVRMTTPTHVVVSNGEKFGSLTSAVTSPSFFSLRSERFGVAVAFVSSFLSVDFFSGVCLLSLLSTFVSGGASFLLEEVEVEEDEEDEDDDKEEDEEVEGGVITPRSSTNQATKKQGTEAEGKG